MSRPVSVASRSVCASARGRWSWDWDRALTVAAAQWANRAARLSPSQIEEIIPEPVRLTREPKGPGAMPLLRGLRQGRVVQAGSGGGFEGHALGLDLQAGVDRIAAVEGLQGQGVQHGKERCVRVVGERLA